jgi:hypothetical protein
MRRAAVIAALVLLGCKSSHPEANDAGGEPVTLPSVATTVEPPTEAPAPSIEPTEMSRPPHASPTSSASAASALARPLSSSLSELGNAPLPALEGDPTIRVDVERVSGGLLPDLTASTMRLRAGMRACYLRSLEDDAPDASSVVLYLTVSTNGSVRAVRQEGASEIDEGAVACMIRRAQTATFPPPVGEPAEVVLRVSFLPPALP